MSNSAQAVKDKLKSVSKDRWISYSRKNSYAKEVTFEETVSCLEQFIKIISSKV